MDPVELLKQLGIDLAKDAENLVPVEGSYDFTIFTRDHNGHGSVIAAYEQKVEGQEDPDFMLSGIASSTIKDLHGDTILPSAILDMERSAKNNLTILLNHKPIVPEDIAGSVTDAKITSSATDDAGNPIFDLEYKVRVNKANPRAVETFKALKGGTKLGMSIGAKIPEGGAIQNKKTGALLISHVELLETSIVAIPANPRSWIDSIAKSFRSGPTKPDDAQLTVHLAVETDTTASIDGIPVAATSGPTQLTAGEAGPETIVRVAATAAAPDPSTTTDAPPQDAQRSHPENDGAVATPDVIAAANDVLARSSDPQVADDEVREILTAAHNALVDVTQALIESDATRTAAEQRAVTAEAERDQMRTDTENVIREVANLIDQVGSLPAGRTASFKAIQQAAAGQVNTFEGLGLAPEVVRLLRSTNA